MEHDTVTVWVVDYDDGDYYCEGNHLIGIYSTEALSDAAIERYKAKLTGQWYGTGYSYAKTEIAIDEDHDG